MTAPTASGVKRPLSQSSLNLGTYSIDWLQVPVKQMTFRRVSQTHYYLFLAADAKKSRPEVNAAPEKPAAPARGASGPATRTALAQRTMRVPATNANGASGGTLKRSGSSLSRSAVGSSLNRTASSSSLTRTASSSSSCSSGNLARTTTGRPGLASRNAASRTAASRGEENLQLYDAGVCKRFRRVGQTIQTTTVLFS